MRMLPFFKPKKGFQLAGSGLDAGSGGGGGGGGGATLNISDTPTKIGTFNGKDLYAIDIYRASAGSASYTLDLAQYNIDRVVNIFVSGIYDNTYECYSIAHMSGYSCQVTGSRDSAGNIISLYCGWGNSLISDIHHVIYFTQKGE